MELLLLIKLLTIPLMFITGYVTGLIPLRMERSTAGDRQFAKGNAFSLGIFLGAGLLHLLPDAQHHWLIWQGPHDFPWPALIGGLSILGILSLEQFFLGGSEDIGSVSDEKQPVYPYLLCTILSIHSVIAGVSMGMETELLATSVLIIALLAHKGSAAFALGVSLLQGGFTTKSHRGIIVLFSGMVPAGIVLGLIFSRFLTGNADAAFEAIFDALAAGTFLYIALIDILPEVFEVKSDRITKLMLILAGFALMAGIAIIA